MVRRLFGQSHALLLVSQAQETILRLPYITSGSVIIALVTSSHGSTVGLCSVNKPFTVWYEERLSSCPERVNVRERRWQQSSINHRRIETIKKKETRRHMIFSSVCSSFRTSSHGTHSSTHRLPRSLSVVRPTIHVPPRVTRSFSCAGTRSPPQPS